MNSYKDIFLIVMLQAVVTAIKVTFVFVGIDDTAAYNSHIVGYISPAVLNVTFETVRKSYPELLADMQVISLVSNDTGITGADPCEIAIRSFPLFAELYGREKDLFVPVSGDRITVAVAGEFCVDPNADVAIFSTAADIIFLSSTVAVELSNTTLLPTTINLYPTPSNIMLATLKALLTLNNWKIFGIICGEDDMMYYWDCTTGFQYYNFWDNQFASSAYQPKLHTHDIEINTTEILKDMKLRVRIIYVMALPKLLRRILVTAHSLNMTNGEFLIGNPLTQRPIFSIGELLHDSEESSADDHKALEGFKRTLIISDLGINWDNLENFTKQSALMSEVLHNRTIPIQGQRDIAAVIFLEVLLIFAQVGTTSSLLETDLGTLYLICKGLNRLLPYLDNMTSSKFIKDLLNHTYDLPSRQLSFFPDGRNVMLTPILRINVSSGKFETAAVCNSDNNVLSILRPSLWAWFGSGRYPPDVPLCGFDGRSCKGLPLVVAVLFCSTVLIAYVIRKKAEDKIFSASFLQNADSSGSLAVSLGSSISRVSIMHNAQFRYIILDMRRLSHPNIGHFYGINITKEPLSLMWEFDDRGNVNDILLSRPVMRDDAILLSLLSDLLQTSALQFHGALDIDTCFINHRYSLKIAKMGCFHLLECLENQQSKQFRTLREKTTYYRSDDVRNFGMISQTFLAHKKSDVVLTEAAHKSLTYEKWTRLTRECVLDDPITRPSLIQVKKVFGQLRKPKNIVDYIIRMMDEQNQQLEVIVLEKTKSLVQERDNVDQLLAEILPRSVVHKLRVKEESIPEAFDTVSVLFSDIPGFSNLLSSCSPWDIISLLNNAYSKFDSIFGLYDAYKVETINDSYMLASGVPTRNGTQHATELCLLALDLLSAAKTCLASYELTARIGINSGPVVAGVIGSKMPRYCLFGDTVNTASRMETSSEAGKIHVNQSVLKLAEKGRGLLFVPRGFITIKGKGEMETFWLQSTTEKA